MKRRDFLSGMAGAGSYSLVYRAGAANAATPAGETGATAGNTGTVDHAAMNPNMARVDLNGDLMVAGGGMAGVCAAIAAARNGAKVVLVQDRSRLGGNASSEVRMHIVGADCHGGRAGWREGGILEELRLDNAVNNPHYAWELWDLLLYDKVVSEPNITLLLDTAVVAADMDGDAIGAVWARCDKTEHLYRIQAPLFADCTGDCRLGLEAGAEFRLGHEGREEFGEDLAPEQPGPETLGSSILFTSKDYGEPIPFTPPTWARKVTKEELEFRGIGSWEYGYWWIEWGGQHDPIADNEMIRKELLSIVLGVWDYIKNSGEHPDSANWGMDWLGMIPGKRGSRRMVGDYMMTQQDMEGGYMALTDGVSIGGWPFDDHPSKGFDDTKKRPARQTKIAEPYNISLRSLHSKNVRNLFMAGRNISATYVAFTSSRVMGTCAAAGQAVGTAAAFCAKRGIGPKDLIGKTNDLRALQQALIRDDQTVRHVTNNDPLDLAQSAQVTASATVDDSAPDHVLSGETRDIPGSWENRWGAELGDDGAWLELRWDQPQSIGYIQIVFDSGFHRELTLSEHAGVKKRVVRKAQPETVRDYTVLAQTKDGGDWKTLVEVTGNHQRLQRHAFDATRMRGLRIHVHATNGNPDARIYEVRCYAEKPPIA